MTITTSFNRHLNKTYAYETTYEWDETRRRKVQKRRCIGQIDPESGKIVPNGKKGRPPLSEAERQTINSAYFQRQIAELQGKEVHSELDKNQLKSGLNEVTGSVLELEELLTEMVHALSRLRNGLETAVGKKAQS